MGFDRVLSGQGTGISSVPGVCLDAQEVCSSPSVILR